MEKQVIFAMTREYLLDHMTNNGKGGVGEDFIKEVKWSNTIALALLHFR
jgi:hypothetical protein